MNVLKSLLQPCYAVMLAFVVLSSPSICTANNNVNFNASKGGIDTSQFYIKFSTGIVTNYDTLEAGIGYRLDRHRMDVRLGFMCHHNCRDNFIQGNYYYNIIEGNKASIFVTGGLVSAFNSDSGYWYRLRSWYSNKLIKRYIFRTLNVAQLLTIDHFLFIYDLDGGFTFNN
ncbi:putative ompA-like autotransporter [Orientia tsutsugamushi str. Gilliam]|uniref:Putative ompA-like autotransporter n=1 Tax=Orientia tsutsugamushi str. Gilliam TaxID=1359184 RepID=A0A0F3M7U7_ORITS|nr:putative ompA-like autotransporter [Orientia tsutsugamushi str. Gilliam]